jgi:hypothetical protein
MGPAGLTDLVALLAFASNSPRTQFSLTLPFGRTQCIEQVGGGLGASKVVLTKAAAQAMLAGQPVGSGAIYVSLSRVQVSPSSTMGHPVFFAAGLGNFSFINH